MNDLLKKTKRIFTVGVVVTTILWSMGASLMVAGVVNAADESKCVTLQVGDVVKSDAGPAIYVLDADMEWVFVEEGWQHKTWYSDNEYHYMDVSEECFKKYTQKNTLPIAWSVRPGVTKDSVFYRPSTNDLYLVTDNYKAKMIEADAAKALTGAETFRSANPGYWVNFTLETGVIKLADLPLAGMLITDGTKNYLVVDATNVKEV
ncbi:MAG: hypothetical protein ABIH87_04045, partial [bacterium]